MLRGCGVKGWEALKGSWTEPSVFHFHSPLFKTLSYPVRTYYSKLQVKVEALVKVEVSNSCPRCRRCRYRKLKQKWTGRGKRCWDDDDDDDDLDSHHMETRKLTTYLPTSPSFLSSIPAFLPSLHTLLPILLRVLGFRIVKYDNCQRNPTTRFLNHLDKDPIYLFLQPSSSYFLS